MAAAVVRQFLPWPLAAGVCTVRSVLQADALVYIIHCFWSPLAHITHWFRSMLVAGAVPTGRAHVAVQGGSDETGRGARPFQPLLLMLAEL